jgi:hypothetical protein
LLYAKPPKNTPPFFPNSPSIYFLKPNRI